MTFYELPRLSQKQIESFNAHVEWLTAMEESGEYTWEECQESLFEWIDRELGMYGKYFDYKGVEVRVSDHPYSTFFAQVGSPKVSFIVSKNRNEYSPWKDEHVIDFTNGLPAIVEQITKTIETLISK